MITRIRRTGIDAAALLLLGTATLSSGCVILTWFSGTSPTPVTTRPDFFPDPRAPVVMLDARPERVTLELQSLVPAESLEITRFNMRDGYVETGWFDPAGRRTFHHDHEIGDLPAAVKIRCWADPWVPGQTRLTVEPVYRPRIDPSRSERDLELIVPPDQPGYKVAEQLIAKLKEKFGTPKSAS